MKHIKLLGILTILIIITEFVLSIPSGMESFQEGMEAGMQEATTCKNNAQTPLPHPIKVTVQVSPVNAPLQTVTLNCGQNRTTQAVYATDSITCNISEPASHAILTIISIITLFPVLYGVYSLIRLLICVSRKEVFSRRNCWWLRWFTYSTALFSLLITLSEWILERAALQQIQLPGYEITGIDKTYVEWSSLFVMMLLTEIFAAGVKLQEEQDLTI